jgi:hypothetical protein
MRARTVLFAGIFALLMVASSAADAATAWTKRSLNLRTGPGTIYAKITTMPAGARIEAFNCASWCEVFYRGYHGWASARYISFSGYWPAPPIVVVPPRPPLYWQYRRPWWDDDYHYRRYRRPGVEFYFEFGG